MAVSSTGQPQPLLKEATSVAPLTTKTLTPTLNKAQENVVGLEFYDVGDQTLEQVSQSSCGVFILVDI